MSTILSHHGIIGQKWGVRRFQNPDGTLTNAGKKRKDTLEKAADKATRFQEYAKESKESYSQKKDSRSKRNARIADDQIKRYSEMAKKFVDMQRDISKVSNEDISRARQFIKKDIFTDADYAYYWFDGKWGNTEEDDNRKASW